MRTTKSPLLDELYGVELSNQVFHNLESLDSDLNKEVQEIAYEHYWAREGLSIREKSLITVSSLISLGREKQIKPHLIGFLNTGGTVDDILNIIIFFNTRLDKKLIRIVTNIVEDILKERSMDVLLTADLIDNSKFIQNKDICLADIASCAALGVHEKTKTSIVDYLDKYNDNVEVKNLLIHLIPYCGFPVAINGFTALKDALATNGCK